MKPVIERRTGGRSGESGGGVGGTGGSWHSSYNLIPMANPVHNNNVTVHLFILS